MGDRQLSEEHFNAAISRCREIGASTLGARAKTAYAETLLSFGDTPARLAAEGLLAEAADTSAELGVRSRAHRLLEGLAV